MKKIILLTCVISLCLQFNTTPLQAQTLYATTAKGGDDGGGAIIKFAPATNSSTVSKSFESNPFLPESNNLMQASDGKLYGMASRGGKKDAGVIFSFDPLSSTVKKLKDFDKVDGETPWGSLVQANNGKLYGMTLHGGTSSSGVIFSFDPSSSVYTKLKDFNASDGTAPFGNLIQASDGKLYGMTSSGGSNNAGVIFSFDPSSFIYTKLKDFNTSDGTQPLGSLMQASNGKLYGMTSLGGSDNAGVIFSFDPSSFSYTKLHDFNNVTGSFPNSSLVQASDGKLYGVTIDGGSDNVGVIFSFDILSSSYAKLMDFHTNDGWTPQASLVQANNGKLYGTTSNGGAFSNGIIFSFEPSSSTYTRLKDFYYTERSGGLMQATNGLLYGLTGGGSSNSGLIISFDITSSTYTKLADLGANKGGSNPLASLIKAKDGKLYGTTSLGGAFGYGVIFSFDPASSVYTKLEDFDSIRGTNPRGSLLQASNGKLYGMTFRGGTKDAGVIFSFDPVTSIYTKLKDFDYGSITGANPNGNLVQATDGKLYGVTSAGSVSGGVIFSLDPSTNVYTKLKNFYFAIGRNPLGSLIQAMDGKLYGMTSAGGSQSGGVIFSFDPSTSTYTKLKDFDNINGGQPSGSLMQASNGKLYGMTTHGGSNKAGVIFSFDPSSSTYIKLKDFNNADGSTPAGNLLEASDGKLYGMTSLGGNNNLGVVFSVDPVTSAFTKLEDFDFTNGANPGIGSAFIEVKTNNKTPTVSITTPAHDTTYIALARIKLNAIASDTDGSITKVEFYNGATLIHTETEAPYDCIIDSAGVGSYVITAKAYDNDGNASTSAPVNITVVPNKLPTVAIKTPLNNASYPAPANVILSALANDPDGRITKLEFYNSNTLIFTETAAPYERKWFHLKIGNYSITAKAYDNNSGVTTSAPVNFSVVPDIAPLVSITSPANGTNFTAPANIELSADASDLDGTVRTVDFYNGNTLLFTEKYLPYSKTWTNVPAGNYSITAVAADNNGKTTTSAPVNISVGAVPAPMARGEKLNSSSKPLSLNINPNPVANTLNISVDGLQANKQSTISLLSVSGVVIKNIGSNNLNKNIQLNVSSLSAGVYFIKVINGDKVLYKQFVKL